VRITDIAKELGIDAVADGTICDETDTHSGNGDGYTFVKISFDNTCASVFESAVDSNSNWKPLPLSCNLQEVVYGQGRRGPYLTDTQDNVLMPSIENGYWYFYDRYEGGGNHHDDCTILVRPSFNFTIAIYDKDEHFLYFCRYDT
jgi:hypothetical protein